MFGLNVFQPNGMVVTVSKRCVGEMSVDQMVFVETAWNQEHGIRR
jgi:hypothetical protein